METDCAILPVASLRPTEETNPDRVRAVTEAILRAGVWSEPILVERETRAVTDGHQRLAAAIRLGLADVPVRLADYGAAAQAPAALPAPRAVPLALLRGASHFADHVRWIWKAGDPVPGRTARRYAAA
ncbi:ParB N-terminal domain-containing protein [Salinarimonas sp.]|uniref:ParB N-terminal domain-containing protein n=1 Tax=Salinarimonas sp. TaxID=2766526 RepID=UPI0032D90E49